MTSQDEFPISQPFTKEEIDEMTAQLGDPNTILEDLLPYEEDRKRYWTDQNYQTHYTTLINENEFIQQTVFQQNGNIQQIPTNVEYDGGLGFEINISSPTTNNWNYSALMKKCYLKIATTLPIDVRFESLPNGNDLYIRAMPLYSLDEFSKEMVQRCMQHLDPKISDNLNIDPSILKHILRCSNDGTMYLGCIDKNEHLNVFTPLPKPQTGVDSVRLNYKFMCKNSCPTGMNRRAIDVIFTLEDAYGTVYGRKKLGVRICSCPKRDKDKEEKEFKDKEECNEPPPKKKKLSKVPMTNSNVDNSLITVPSLDLIGSDIVHDMLRFAQDRIYAEVLRGRFKNGDEARAKDCAKKLGNLMKELKDSKPADN